MKSLILSILFLTKFLYAADDIRGYWKAVNEKGTPQCIFAIYQHDGLCYGRIIATYSDTEIGKIEDSIYEPFKRAPGVVGNPFYSGLDIIWYLEEAKFVHKGQILDPQKGKIYKAELWTDGPDLIVRGKLLMFGRNQRWYPVTKEDLPEGFVLPELKSLVPSIPQVN